MAKRPREEKVMKYLVLIMFLIGCGADPDDFKVEESDGCKSNDTECKAAVDGAKVATATATATTTESETESAVEEETKVSVKTTVIVENEVTIGKEGETIKAETAEQNCQAGKICRGTAKAEIIDLLGEPKTITKEDPFEVWNYSDYSENNLVCPAWTKCTITFRSGLVVDQNKVKAEYIDLENF